MNDGMLPTHFHVYAFSPDGEFTCDELKEYINRGIAEINRAKGVGFRMSPITVEILRRESVDNKD